MKLLVILFLLKLYARINKFNRMYTFIKDLSNKYLTIVFSNSVIIIVAKTGTKGVCMDTSSFYL